METFRLGQPEHEQAEIERQLGIGEDILPKNVNFDIIDGFTKVTDKDAAVYTQRLAKEEGMFLGNSAGAAIKGVLQLKEHFKKDDIIVVLFHDRLMRR